MKKASILFVPSLLVLLALLAAAQLASAATDTWTGNTDANWSTPGNWVGGNAPVAGDSLSFGSSSQTTPNNDFTADTAFYGLTFTADAEGLGYTLDGNSVLLSGQAFGNNIGITNNSGSAQSVGTMPLDLDWGYHTFTSPSGSLALDSAITPNTGGVAYFGPANLTSTLSTDGSGLISGLGGAGLMYDGVLTPTGLATIDGGGNIVAYSAYTPVASGAIGNGNNIQLTASGVAGSYTANNNTVNTITVSQAGGANNSDFTSTLTVTGTLTLGANGGICVLNSAGTNHADFSLTGGSVTAGTSGPASIVFTVNGSNPNNQASVSSPIVDNAGPGAVTVVKTGSGSMNFATTTATSYSGGTYVNQGQLQWGQVTGVGTGPIYVAANASAYYTGATAFTNDFYLSPGLGAGAASASANQGALNASSTVTLSGTMHLLGAPVPAGPGDRFTVAAATGGTLTISGKITGTGTLDIAVTHSDYCQIGNTRNDWSGGLVLGQIASGGNANCYFRPGSNNVIPHGSGKGDVMINGPSAAVARFDINGHSETINGLNSKGTYPVNELVGTFQGGQVANTLTLGDGDANGTFYGRFSDNNQGSDVLNLIKIGAGTQTLSGIVTNHGTITVSAGTLALSGSSAWPVNSPTVSVASGATLDVSGLTSGGTVGAAQTLSCLGTVVGTVAVNGTVNAFQSVIGTYANNGSVTLNGGGTYNWDINGATGTAGADPGWSQINITGGLTIAATSGSPFTINLTSLTTGDVAGSVPDFDNTANYAWSIVKTTGGITGFDPSAFVLNTAGFANSLGSGQFFITANATDLILLFLQRPSVTSTEAGHGAFSGAPNLSYTVQYADDLTAPVNWQTLTTATTDGSGNGSFIDATAPAGQPQRFYRVIYP